MKTLKYGVEGRENGSMGHLQVDILFRNQQVR